MRKRNETTAAEPEQKPEEVDFMRFLNEMRTSLSQSLSGVLLRGARPVPVGISPGASPSASSSPGRLVGWSLTEAGNPGSDASVRLYDGNPADGGLLVASIPLAVLQNTTESLNPGPSLVRGLYVQTTGTVEGSVWLGAVD